jgi:transposase
VSVTRRAKRLLSPGRKYDLRMWILAGQITQSDAVAEAGVDRTRIAGLRKVAREGAIAALQSSRPGQRKVRPQEASELAKLRAEVDRLERW